MARLALSVELYFHLPSNICMCVAKTMHTPWMWVNCNCIRRTKVAKTKENISQKLNCFKSCETDAVNSVRTIANVCIVKLRWLLISRPFWTNTRKFSKNYDAMNASAEKILRQGYLESGYGVQDGSKIRGICCSYTRRYMQVLLYIRTEAWFTVSKFCLKCFFFNISIFECLR